MSEAITQPTYELAEIRLDQIDVGTRFRREFDEDKLKELKVSIQQYGIISPIALLRKNAYGAEIPQAGNPDRPYLLLAGERRSRAAFAAGLETIPARIFSELVSEDQIREIELFENIHREDLLWPEQVALRKEIFDIRQRKAGVKVSTSPDAVGASMRSVAEEMGVSHATLSRDIKLANALETMPELADAPDKRSAEKILERKKVELAKAELARRQREKDSKTPEDQRKKAIAGSYILLDFFKGVEQVPDNTIDFVEIDPPYAVDLDAAKRNGLTEHYNEIDAGDYPAFMSRVLDECLRVMKAHSFGICWFAPEPWFEHVYRWIIAAGKPADMELREWVKSGKGFICKRMPIVWGKGIGQTNAPMQNLANGYELAFYFRKGMPTLQKQGRSNLYTFDPLHSSKKIHPTQRPIGLMTEILQTFCLPGAKVMVPFAGSGVTIRAASNTQMQAFGWDIGKAYKDAHDTIIYQGEPGKYEL
jgi:ParB/RepB/Spo0J family partition protein